MSSPPHDRTNFPGEPFDDVGSSDTIFRTSDGINFYVHRVVLFLASPFFRTMFSLPQPTSHAETKPVIEAAESSETLDPLLRLCYPVTDPDFTNPARVGDVLEAAMKYQLSEAIAVLKKTLQGFIHDNSLQVFWISCRLQLEEEASLAAHRWKEISPDVDGRIVAKGKFLDWKETIAGASYVDEMADISAGAYHRLTQFVRTGEETSFCAPANSVGDAGIASLEFNFSDSDLTVISSDGVKFQVHELIIRLASSDILQNVATNEHGRRQVSLPEDSRILSKLFEIYYPTTDFNLSDLSLAFPLLLAARKYQMGKAITNVKAILRARMYEDPLRVYLTLVRNGFTEEAAEVVRNALLQKPIDGLYVPEMEDIPAQWHFQLLEHRHQCLSALVKICSKYESDSNSTSDSMQWWNVVAPNYSTVPAGTIFHSFAIPVVQRKLLFFQNEAGKCFEEIQNDWYRFREGLVTIPDFSFSLGNIHCESIELEEEVNLALSKIALQISTT